MPDPSPQPPPRPASDVTLLLQAAADGDGSAMQRLLPLVYQELLLVARRRMQAERSAHTLQATALVHEAYLRLLGGSEASIHWSNRAQFFHAAAEAMRRILIEHARSRGRQKRGGDRSRLDIAALDVSAGDDSPVDLLALDEAICRLESMDARAASIVRLRFFAGLSVEETAEALELSERTVKRDWLFARAWLFEQLGAA